MITFPQRISLNKIINFVSLHLMRCSISWYLDAQYLDWMHCSMKLLHVFLNTVFESVLLILFASVCDSYLCKNDFPLRGPGVGPVMQAVGCLDHSKLILGRTLSWDLFFDTLSWVLFTLSFTILLSFLSHSSFHYLRLIDLLLAIF